MAQIAQSEAAPCAEPILMSVAVADPVVFSGRLSICDSDTSSVDASLFSKSPHAFGPALQPDATAVSQRR